MTSQWRSLLPCEYVGDFLISQKFGSVVKQLEWGLAGHSLRETG